MLGVALFFLAGILAALIFVCGVALRHTSPLVPALNQSILALALPHGIEMRRSTLPVRADREGAGWYPRHRKNLGRQGRAKAGKAMLKKNVRFPTQSCNPTRPGRSHPDQIDANRR